MPRWMKAAMLPGEPSWHTRSTWPISMPSSSEAVAGRGIARANHRADARGRTLVGLQPVVDALERMAKVFLDVV